MKRWMWALALMLTWLLAWERPRLARADNGPHGGYTPTTDACAGCHRAHTAVGPALLTAASSTELCLTCHGAGGTGADTDVLDGVYLERDNTVESPAEGVVNRGLKGGGFQFARMDTGWVGDATPRAVTSAHLMEGSTGIAWGGGAWGSGPGTSMTLACTSCHDPHGNAGPGGTPTYRILRPVPRQSGSTQVVLDDETPKRYTIAANDGKYFGEEYDNTLYQNLAAWCATCHDRYLAPDDSGHTDTGDPIFAYRHISQGQGCGCHNLHGGPPPTGNPEFRHDPLSCLTCHVAHGSTARMSGHAGVVPWPNGNGTPSGDARSALLRVDNRGTCELCHDK